jgi:hypothetical protein
LLPVGKLLQLDSGHTGVLALLLVLLPPLLLLLHLLVLLLLLLLLLLCGCVMWCLR